MTTKRRQKKTVFQKFCARVRLPTEPNGCWEWIGSPSCRYCVICASDTSDRRDKKEYAHRYSYKKFIGPIPEGMQIDHLCRNPRCVNPEHLEPVTNRENGLRGTSPCAVAAKKTHCKRGHPFSGDNLLFAANGTRKCRECSYQAHNEYMRRRRAARAAAKLNAPMP